MKKTFWKAQFEFYKDKTVKAAVISSMKAKYQPEDRYRKDQWREICVFWYPSKKKALADVKEALAMNPAAAL